MAHGAACEEKIESLVNPLTDKALAHEEILIKPEIPASWEACEPITNKGIPTGRWDARGQPSGETKVRCRHSP